MQLKFHLVTLTGATTHNDALLLVFVLSTWGAAKAPPFGTQTRETLCAGRCQSLPFHVITHTSWHTESIILVCSCHGLLSEQVHWQEPRQQGCEDCSSCTARMQIRLTSYSCWCFLARSPVTSRRFAAPCSIQCTCHQAKHCWVEPCAVFASVLCFDNIASSAAW